MGSGFITTPYIPIRELLVGYRRPDEVVLVLRVYLDESGKLKDPRETASAVGGVIGQAKAFVEFEIEWAKMLEVISKPCEV